ncbi:guanine deaminase [Acanthamoeba castellanii str. Neff]|uniref:Guanine deaminase n=1 Tax=Acanthamoeba castellanii (strain ATCC 30010 / Neff) TaxID=1257118 RepID=L8HHX2_ACACF|nr:guanine deaminase [Acanthamoeba castellanii str. Neff]ELR24812.1 guanine deaminase [Acanthamoeba castellanii str. Neff]
MKAALMETNEAVVVRVFHGTVVHSLALDQLDVVPRAWLGVDATGRIAFLQDGSLDRPALILKHKLSEAVEFVELPRRGFIVPGMVDTHAHAPQFVNAGNGLDMPLLEWLETYTFPAETRFKDADYAKKIYTAVVRRSLGLGTTTISYFGTIHAPANKVLAEAAAKYGQRAFVGKVCMDRNSPAHYVETTADSLRDTAHFCEEVLAMGDPLITPILTPRFTPTCTMELMTGLSEIARKHDLPIQTHVSESKAEVAWVKELHPDQPTYTHTYHQAGLLTKKTVLAHAVHLTEPEEDLVLAQQAGISHCPNSNFSLLSGMCPVRRFLNKGIKVGLGTDVSGGFCPNMLDAFRLAIIASKMVHTEHTELAPLNVAEGFYLLTLGGARVLDIDDKVGNFLVGKELDALVVAPFAEGSPIDEFDAEDVSSSGGDDEAAIKRTLEKWLFLGDDRNLAQVYVCGRPVLPFAL